MAQPSFKEIMDVNFIDAFLSAQGLEAAERFALPGDASNRRYERIYHKDNNLMLMIAPPGKEDVRPFIKIDRILRDCGLNAPEILAEDLGNGLLLLEDFGDDLYSKVLREARADEAALYEAAHELLGRLPSGEGLEDYSDEKLVDEALLLVDWFASEADREGFVEIWQGLLGQLERGQKVLVLRDYHADNLMWLPERRGAEKIGLLDFQDAVCGHPAYDLVSLLEDARRDVTPAVVAGILQGKTPEFIRDYFILGAQRNCKIIGIFNRLKKRDGKEHYLKYLPRVWAHLRGDLEYPVMAPLKKWFAENNVQA